MKRLFSIFMLILLPVIAFCQAEKQLVPSDLKQQTVVTEPITLNKGFFRAGVNVSYGVTDKYFNDKGKKIYFLNSGWGSSSSSNLTLQYGITNRLQVDISLNYMSILHKSQNIIFVPSADTTADYSFTLKGRGIGDSYFSFKYQIFPEREGKPSLTGIVQITMPTGEKNPKNIKGPLNFDPPVGNGNFAAAVNITGRKTSYPYSYTAYLDYTYKFSGTKLINATDTEEKNYRDGNGLMAGVGFNYQLNDWIALTNDLSFFSRGKNKVENIIPEGSLSAWVISYETHLVFQIKQFRLAEAIIIPLKGKNNVSADPQYVIIAQYLF